MYLSDIFSVIFFILLVLAVGAYPLFLYYIIQKIPNPSVRFWAAPASVAVAIILSIILLDIISLSGPEGLASPFHLLFTYFMFFLIFTTAALAVVTPIFFLGVNRTIERRWWIVFFSSYISLPFLFIFIFSFFGESIPGGPLPALSLRLPLLVGWIFDGLISLFHLPGTPFYKPVYDVMMNGGLYLELLIIYTLFFGVLRYGFDRGK